MNSQRSTHLCLPAPRAGTKGMQHHTRLWLFEIIWDTSMVFPQFFKKFLCKMLIDHNDQFSIGSVLIVSLYLYTWWDIELDRAKMECFLGSLLTSYLSHTFLLWECCDHTLFHSLLYRIFLKFLVLTKSIDKTILLYI